LKLTSLSFFFVIVSIVFSACGSSDDGTPQVLQATVPPDAQNAPIYSPTPTLTVTPSPTFTITPSITPSPTLTNTPTITPSPTLTNTPTNTLSPTPSPTVTPSPTLTPTFTPTPPVFTLTSPANNTVPTYVNPTTEFSTPDGWSCGENPCEDDIRGFLQRIKVPEKYTLSYIGRFPGQPLQITYGPDNLLYGTVLTDPVNRVGAVYRLVGDGDAEQYGPQFVSPVGLAFQPGTDVLYVSSRLELESGGGVWRVLSDRSFERVIDTLPCCFSVIDNQPNGMVFGPDGYLYLGVGSLTDHGEPANPQTESIAEFHPYEAAILRIQPHTGEIETFAQGIRNPYDLSFDTNGQFYAVDNGILAGPGDRILRIDAGGHYGWPFWRTRGCEDCLLTDGRVSKSDDLLSLPDYTLPRGLTAYTGTQFPANLVDDLFVTFWHGTGNEPRIVRIDPETVPTDPDQLALYEPEPFVTGLIRPIDVVVAPDGTLVFADFVYGHVWKVSYGEAAESNITPDVTAVTATSAIEDAQETQTPALFVTSTPRP